MKNIKIFYFFLINCFVFTTVNAQEININAITPQFNGSGGVTLDDEGSLYIGDFGDFLSAGDIDGQPNNVWKLDTDLNLTIYSGGFVGASGNAFDSNEVLYQSDVGNNTIYKIVNGVRTFVSNVGISVPIGLAFDDSDNLFVCNCGNNTIRKITPSGVSTLLAIGGALSCPNGLTIDEDNNLYISNFGNGNIVKVTPTGTQTILNSTPGGTTSGPSNGHLDYHEPTRSLFIASHGSNKIFKLQIDDPSNLIFVAGSGIRGNTDGDAQTASFSRPNGVAVTQTGDSIYINSAIPVTNVPNGPLNPQLIRLIKGVNSLSVETSTLSNSIKVFPNPTNNTLTIKSNKLKQSTEFVLKIMNVQGKIIKVIKDFDKSDDHEEIVADLSSLASGTYFYELYNDKRLLIVSGKLIRE